MRTCKICLGSFPANEEFFYRWETQKNGRALRGLRGECRVCFLALRHARYHGPEHEILKNAGAASKRKQRLRPEVAEKERAWSRTHERAQYADPVESSRLAEYLRKWRSENPERYAAYKSYKGTAPSIVAKNRFREIAKTQATPPWVDPGSLRPFYEEAARLTSSTGIKHSVDHIMPLKGKTSCGLHVPWNLQVMPHVENMRKGNKVMEDEAVAFA